MDFKILIDYREKTPWTFDNVRALGYPVTLEVTKNATADYSLEGGRTLCAVERKTLVDFQRTLRLCRDLAGNRNRDRFELEIQRMQAIRRSYIVVEAPLSRVLKEGLNVKNQIAKLLLLRAILRLKKRYPRTQWIFAADRDQAQLLAYLILRKAASQLNRENEGGDRRDGPGSYPGAR